MSQSNCTHLHIARQGETKLVLEFTFDDERSTSLAYEALAKHYARGPKPATLTLTPPPANVTFQRKRT